MHSAASTVEFNFDSIIYKQIDGIVMGSPLKPALANIFVGYHKKKIFSEIIQSAVYFRCVDDTFALLQDEKEPEECLIKFNGMHSFLKFMFEKEKNRCLPSRRLC